jgi:hypothetical protein
MPSAVEPVAVSTSSQVTKTPRQKEARAITVWHYLEWRCEYWQGNGASELRLYRGETLFQLARPRDTFEVLERSASWHNELPIPEIRSGRDRRTVRRGGRRADDRSE